MFSLMKKTKQFILSSKKKREERENVVEGQTEETQQVDNLSDDVPEEKGVLDEKEVYKNKGKLFVGGLSRSTTSVDFKNYFSTFGKVVDSVVIVDPESKKSRGFGFVTFANPEDADTCLRDKNHILDGKKIDPRPFYSNKKLKAIVEKRKYKIFLGGLPFDVTEEDLREFFKRYGEVEDVRIPVDRKTKKPKGFGFLTFKEESAAEKCQAEGFVYMSGRRVQMKKAGFHSDSKTNDNISIGSTSDVEVGLEIGDDFNDDCEMSFAGNETQSVASEAARLLYEQDPNIQKLFDEYFLKKFTIFKKMNDRKSEDGQVSGTEPTEVEMLLAEFLINTSKETFGETFGRDLIEFSSESDSKDSDIDFEECTTDEEEDGDEYSSASENAQENFEYWLEKLSTKFAGISVNKSTFSEEEISSTPPTAPETGLSLAGQNLTGSFKFKDSEGSLVCSLCQWIPPHRSFESFLAHCKTPAHRAKLKERFSAKDIQDKKSETELLQINNPIQTKNVKFPEKPHGLVLENQKKIQKNEKCNEKQQKLHLSSLESLESSKMKKKPKEGSQAKETKVKKVENQNEKQQKLRLSSLESSKMKKKPKEGSQAKETKVKKAENQNEKYNEKQQKPHLSSLQHLGSSKIKKWPKERNQAKETKAKKAENQGHESMQEQKKRIKLKNNTALRVNALASQLACIQPISENEMMCGMCNKIIPKALDFSNLMRNLSHHLQSRGHLQKLLETQETLSKEPKNDTKKKSRLMQKKIPSKK